MPARADQATYARPVAATLDDDDSRDRWVVQRYRMDAERDERRHVPVAIAHGDEELEAAMDAARRQLADDRSSGRAEDCERISAVFLEAGYRERVRAQRENTSGDPHRLTASRPRRLP